MYAQVLAQPKYGLRFRSRMVRGGLGDHYRETVLAPDARTTDHLDRRVAAALLDEHVTGARDHAHRLWLLLVLRALGAPLDERFATVMRALVTGGAGFIGHHLVRAMREHSDEVAVIDDSSTGQLNRLQGLDGVELIKGSILDAEALDAAARDREVIFHEAAIPSVARSVRAPKRTNEVNTTGTIEVMLAASRHGVRRVVFAGSSSVYGASPTLPRRESDVPDPRSPYAASKLAGEGYVHSLGCAARYRDGRLAVLQHLRPRAKPSRPVLRPSFRGS